MACLLGMLKDVPHFSGLSSIGVKVKSMWPLVRHTSFERGGVWDLSRFPMPTWICVDSIIPCPGVIDKEGADTVGVQSSQTITLRMMITTTHIFHGIKERAHVFIPLKSKPHRDTRPLWRMAFSSYLDGVWEWVQVTTYHNVGINLKQLIEVLHCDLQVKIHEELVKVQADILEAIANFIITSK